MATTTIDRPLSRGVESKLTLFGLLGSTDHKVIGIRYILTGLLFFALSGIEVLFIRLQLGAPLNTVLSPDVYNEFFTMHGTTMIFFFATPVFFGLGSYLVPLMIGSRNMAFPRLNALSYWVFLLSGLFMYSSFLFGMAPNGGGFAYIPLPSKAYSPGLNLDFWALGLIFLSIATTAVGLNFIVTLIKLRAPGMSIVRMPLFCWSILVSAFTLIFAIPPLTVANILLVLERDAGFHFFQATTGGNPLLWQYLFWVSDHPDVFIIFLPIVGVVSEIVGTFSRRPVMGYTLLAIATVAIGIIGFAVWIVHMFTPGISPQMANSFSLASVVIGIPSSILIFAWLGTLLTGKPNLKTPLLFIAGFIIVFVIGILTGVIIPAVAFNQQATGSFFAVAQLHFILAGGAALSIFAAFYYWFPKMSGRMMSEKLGQWSFWTMFVGFSLTFFPMYILGVLGMPRRIYTYAPGNGWDVANLVATIGTFILAFGIWLTLTNMINSLLHGERAADNPWEASSLEWSTSSPPPPYNFSQIPFITSREPLWVEDKLRLEESNQLRGAERVDPTDPVRGEALVTSTLDAAPESIIHLPGGSLLPLWLALGLTLLFLGLLIGLLWLAGVGAAMCVVLIAIWLWQTQ